MYFKIRLNGRFIYRLEYTDPMSLKTTVGIAKIGTKSLRATIPEGIVAYLDIRAGDKLEWKMEIINGERVVFVRKISGGS